MTEEMRKHVSSEQSCLVRHDSWSFVSFKHRQSKDEAAGPRSMFPSLSTMEQQETKALIPSSISHDSETRKHNSLLDMSIVSRHSGPDWTPFKSMKESRHNGENGEC